MVERASGWDVEENSNELRNLRDAFTFPDDLYEALVS